MKNRTIYTDLVNEPVRTALLLAAGTGSRLAPLTDSTPKCLVKVNGISILERLIASLHEHNFNRLIVVLGHQGESIRDYLGSRKKGMDITYITSPLYKTTNNIYSLWLAREVIEEPFLLVESDLVFDTEMLTDLLHPDRIAVAKIEPWMNGTTVTLNEHMEIDAFHSATLSPDEEFFKTVNIYSLSLSSWRLVRQRLEQYISSNKVSGYYETVFADMVKDGCLSFTPVFFDNSSWYEIDTIGDLRAAELIFALPQQPSFDVTAGGKEAFKIKVSIPKLPSLNLLQ
ncbi:MAG: choline kinase [Desulforhopalus sp.]|jgi:choline kinase